jgi:hypothetical protein
MGARREECKRNRLKVKPGKKRQNGWKGRVQDTDGMMERKEKEHAEEGERERNIIKETGMPVKWKD